MNKLICNQGRRCFTENKGGDSACSSRLTPNMAWISPAASLRAMASGSSCRTMPTSRPPLHVVEQQFSGQCHHQILDGYHAFDMAIRIQQQLQMLTQ